MAKYDITFIDLDDDASIQTYTEDGYIKIIIHNSQKFPAIINLDISTSIKFAKTLRTEINKAKEFQDGDR
jgi:hypothetical protein